MSYDDSLAQRVRAVLANRADVLERKMFGGLTFVVRGNMCCGVLGSDLVVRVGPENYRAILGQPHVREMDFTGRALKGLVYVDRRGISLDQNLRTWVDRGLEYAASLPAKQRRTGAKVRRSQTRSVRRRRS